MMEVSKETVDTVTSLGGISALAACSRCILSEDRRTFIGFLRGLVLGIFMAVIVGSVINGYKINPQFYNAAIGITAFCADDILMLALRMVAIVSNNPQAVLNWILRRNGDAK